MQMKQTAAQLEADERSLAAKEYEAGLADRRRKEAEVSHSGDVQHDIFTT